MEYDSNREIFYHQTQSGFIFTTMEIWYFFLVVLFLASVLMYTVLSLFCSKLFLRKSHRH